MPDDVSFDQLDSDVRDELLSLPKSLAEVVGRHMVAAGRLLDEEPERAYEHAAFARRRASRMGVVRESAGIAAYTVGKWQEALSDLRAARRMTGRDDFLAVIADCERGLGRPERALEIVRDPAAADLPTESRIELRIVAAGARRDLGQPEAAVVELQVPELKERRARPWVARLFYAYADACLEVGRRKDAREYFARASSVDRESLTDADERLAEMEGVQIVDVGEDVVWTDAEDLFTGEEPERSDESPGVSDQSASSAAGEDEEGGADAADYSRARASSDPDGDDVTEHASGSPGGPASVPQTGHERSAAVGTERDAGSPEEDAGTGS
ncbi:hypothetical protein EKD16_16465 [Streptomonospora litoralis]|uniref:Tetratricopeptide TPR_4 n=1 Tax=Streptomonospora litoralis TaxID=2498135 RepID=A0A4P6Q393_9ACTN|nr:hypothetical protein EKD16_16465 [Streptomonospora litoralis]